VRRGSAAWGDRDGGDADSGDLCLCLSLPPGDDGSGGGFGLIWTQTSGPEGRPPLHSLKLTRLAGVRSPRASSTISGPISDGAGTVMGSSPGKAWARIWVRIRPGSSTLTRTAVFSISSPQASIRASAPALVAA